MLLVTSGEEILGLVFLRLVDRRLWYVDRLLSHDHQNKLNILLVMYRCFRDAGHAERTLSHNMLVGAKMSLPLPVSVLICVGNN